MTEQRVSDGPSDGRINPSSAAREPGAEVEKQRTFPLACREKATRASGSVQSAKRPTKQSDVPWALLEKSSWGWWVG